MPRPGFASLATTSAATGRTRREQTVHELQSGQDSAAAVGDIEGERARPADGRIPGVGIDVLLDERGQGGFTQIAVAVHAGVDEEVDVARRDVSRPRGMHAPRRPRAAGRCDGAGARHSQLRWSQCVCP